MTLGRRTFIGIRRERKESYLKLQVFRHIIIVIFVIWYHMRRYINTDNLFSYVVSQSKTAALFAPV